MPDSNLVAQLAKGDERAFIQLIREHQDRVYNVCYGYMRDYEEARDIAQEVFVEVMRSAKSFRRDSTVQTWLYRIAVNKSLDRLRYLKRDKRSGEEQPIDFSMADQSPTPHQQLERKEREEHLWDAIEQLPPNQKTSLILFNFEGLTYQEIAEVMETTKGSVESLIFRARKNLKGILEKKYAGVFGG